MGPPPSACPAQKAPAEAASTTAWASGQPPSATQARYAAKQPG